MTRLNIGSGQRRFEAPWVNIDKLSRPPDQVPDLICDVGRDRMPFEDAGVGMCVLHQVLEHFHLGPEMEGVVSECFRVLQPGGSLIITVPDMRALAQRWLSRQIEDYIFFVNVYGAWQGQDGDDHHWGFSGDSLWRYLKQWPWKDVHGFDWRPIPGAAICKDWWILGMEAVK